MSVYFAEVWFGTFDGVTNREGLETGLNINDLVGTFKLLTGLKDLSNFATGVRRGDPVQVYMVLFWKWQWTQWHVANLLHYSWETQSNESCNRFLPQIMDRQNKRHSIMSDLARSQTIPSVWGGWYAAAVEAVWAPHRTLPDRKHARYSAAGVPVYDTRYHQARQILGGIECKSFHAFRQSLLGLSLGWVRTVEQHFYGHCYGYFKFSSNYSTGYGDGNFVGKLGDIAMCRQKLDSLRRNNKFVLDIRHSKYESLSALTWGNVWNRGAIYNFCLLHCYIILSPLIHWQEWSIYLTPGSQMIRKISYELTKNGE